EREHATIRRDQPVTPTRRHRRNPHDPCVQPHRAQRTREARVTEREHATIRGGQPVAPTRRRGRDPDDPCAHPHPAQRTRDASRRTPTPNTPPPAAANQYPRPDGEAAIPTIGAASERPRSEPRCRASPNAVTPPVGSAIQ